MGQIILWTLAVFFVIQLLGCVGETRYFKVHREVVACRLVERDSCGMVLKYCNDGRKFHCLLDLEELPAPGKQ